MTAPDELRDPLERANQRIRDAAKWLLASSAAVGAALIAGSQLSSIGKLELAWPTSVATARLWVAIVGAMVGLAAVVFALWTAVGIMLPRQILVADIDAAWQAMDARERHELTPVAAFFRRYAKYLQGFDSPAAVIAHRASLVRRYEQTPAGADADQLKAEIDDMDSRIAAIEDMGVHEALKAQFRASLRRLLVAGAVAALGIVAFAWAANPPASPAPAADLRNARLVNAYLRDADLRGARLDGADLTGADLTGADLTGASVTGVTWRNTICPDGKLSEQAGGTCAGHLR
jgi:hypothetical protein